MKINIKHILLISPFLVLFTSSFTAGITPPEDPTFVFEPALFGPYDGNEGEQTLSFSYSYMNNVSHTKVYELLEGHYGGQLMTRDYTDYHTLVKGGTYNINLTFYPFSFAVNSNMDIIFMIIDDYTHTILHEKNFTVDKKQPLNINTTGGLSEKVITSRKNLFSLTKGETYAETYDFTKTEDVFGNRNYYRLDISNIHISYSSVKPFDYGMARLYFYDTRNLFPSMYRDPSSGATSFYLDVIEEDGRLSFSFKDKYYVNPKTLEISSGYRPGWRRSSYCYLPLKRRKDLEGTKFYLHITGAGFNDSTITHQLTYYSSKNFFGNCVDSEYCIKGGNI